MKRIILLLTLFILSNSANSTPVNYLEITGGTFTFGGETLTLNPAAHAAMNIDGVSFHGSQPAGHPVIETEESLYPASIATTTHSLLGAISIYTADSPFDHISGLYSAPSGEINQETSELTLDLSSWTFYTSELFSAHNIGSSSDLVEGSICVSTNSSNCTTPIITTYDAFTGEFTASWVSWINHGSLPGVETSTYITGYVSTVPVPAAFWLFCSGLFALLGISRLKRQ